MFNSTASHFQNPNPNPNCDQIFTNYSVDRLNDSTYFEDIANFLMSNEDEESSGENVSLKNMDVSQNATFDGSLNSISLAHNMREVKKSERQKGCRFAFRTKTDLEFMDDGFKWRKYGKKMVKNSPNPRNYFKCSSGGCIVKKRVERDAEDPRYVITTYEGIHNHESPSCMLYCSPQASSLLHASSI